MNCLEKANEIINGERRESYGPVEESFKRMAVLFSLILKTEVTPHQYALCMIAMKLMREVNKHSPDNLIDIAGYTALAEKVVNLK
jgi:hypothetical protein